MRLRLTICLCAGCRDRVAALGDGRDHALHAGKDADGAVDGGGLELPRLELVLLELALLREHVLVLLLHDRVVERRLLALADGRHREQAREAAEEGRAADVREVRDAAGEGRRAGRCAG